MMGKLLNLLVGEGVKGDRAKTFYIGQQGLLQIRAFVTTHRSRIGKVLGPLPFTPSPSLYINDLDDVLPFTTPSPALHLGNDGSQLMTGIIAGGYSTSART